MSTKEKENFSNPFQATFNGILNLNNRKKNSIEGLKAGERLDNKKVLITGSSSGLGLAAAKQLAQLGAEVIMAVRSGIPEKAKEVKLESGSDKVHMLKVDLSDFDSIKNLVDELKTKFGKIDILVCNAAVVAKKSRKTSFGYEEMFSVNYLAKYLLIRLLVSNDCFARDKNRIPRIILVSSESHRDPKEFKWSEFGVFQSHGVNQTVALYGYYKLLLTTFSVELARRLNLGEDVKCSVFTLCPGPVNSNIAREAPALFQPLLKLVFKLFFRSPETAAEPIIYFAASPMMEGIKCEYFFLMNQKHTDSKASNRDNGKKLWDITEELFKKHKIEF